MRSVQRILAILESFTPEKSSLTLHEISERIDLPKSTTFRIVQALEKEGYLLRIEDLKYCLSFRFLRFAGLVRSTLGIRDVARPVMSALAEKTKETVTLQTMNGTFRVCIDAMAAASPLRSVSQPGEQAPLGAGGASSKVLISLLGKKEATPFVAQIARATGRTQASVLDELAQIRIRGFAVSHGERVLGVSALASPIQGVQEESRYCIAIAGPTVRIQEQETELVELIRQAAADISRQYGGSFDASTSRKG